ncbi:hypothetical protein C0995_006188 [Termitomyces sp. Mi166|nr:hypothetical protein C0995_006188 [Termitomyces sp. Mi166\
MAIPFLRNLVTQPPDPITPFLIDPSGSSSLMAADPFYVLRSANLEAVFECYEWSRCDLLPHAFNRSPNETTGVVITQRLPRFDLSDHSQSALGLHHHVVYWSSAPTTIFIFNFLSTDILIVASPPLRFPEDKASSQMTSSEQEALDIALASRRVLLLLDVQQLMLLNPLEGGVPASKRVKENISRILAHARLACPQPLIVHVRNCGDPGDLDEPKALGWKLIFEVEHSELVVDKRKNNAFAGTTLGDIIPTDAELIVAGFLTDYSIRATCTDALKRGNEVLIIRGTHATHDRIEVLHGGGITPANRIETEVEVELEEAGVHILDMKDVPGLFTNR